MGSGAKSAEPAAGKAKEGQETGAKERPQLGVEVVPATAVKGKVPDLAGLPLRAGPATFGKKKHARRQGTSHRAVKRKQNTENKW